MHACVLAINSNRTEQISFDLELAPQLPWTRFWLWLLATGSRTHTLVLILWRAEKGMNRKGALHGYGVQGGSLSLCVLLNVFSLFSELRRSARHEVNFTIDQMSSMQWCPRSFSVCVTFTSHSHLPKHTLLLLVGSGLAIEIQPTTKSPIRAHVLRNITEKIKITTGHLEIVNHELVCSTQNRLAFNGSNSSSFTFLFCALFLVCEATKFYDGRDAYHGQRSPNLTRAMLLLYCLDTLSMCQDSKKFEDVAQEVDRCHLG